jgi:Flp pilus assembly protein TadG
MARTRTTRLGHFYQEEGQEIAEAAVVMPILCLVLLAIFWFGRAFNIASTVERAAKHGVQATNQTSRSEPAHLVIIREPSKSKKKKTANLLVETTLTDNLVDVVENAVAEHHCHHSSGSSWSKIC